MASTAPAGEPDTIGTEQAKALLGFANSGNVRRLIHRKVLPARKVGHDWLISRRDVERLKARQRAPGPPNAALSGVAIDAIPDDGTRWRGNLRKVLPALGMTNAEFYHKAGVSEALFYRVENGQRAATRAYRALAQRVTGKPWQELFVPQDGG